MGYTHGKHWTDERIKEAIREVMTARELDRMPSRKECSQHFGDECLTNAVSKRKGGWASLAAEMGLSMKNSETYFGNRHEAIAVDMLHAHGFDAERMPQNFPYDILVNGCIKVDVKVSHLYRGTQGNFYSFNLEKKFATCDIYILFTVSDENEITGIYIVPSKFVMRNTQICIGEYQSKYRKFLDKWDYIDLYSDFFEAIV